MRIKGMFGFLCQKIIFVINIWNSDEIADYATGHMGITARNKNPPMK